MDRQFSVIPLGTGTPQAEPERWGPAVAVVIGERALLFDAGSGVTRRMTAMAERGVDALRLDRATTLFLTHLHSDHTVGLPELMLTPWGVGRRQQQLEVFGPHGTAALVDGIVSAFDADVSARYFSSPAAAGSRIAETHEIGPGIVYQGDGIEVHAFEVTHWNMGETKAYGYRINADGRSVVISGDTSPNPEIERQARGVDVLVHSVYPAQLMETRSLQSRGLMERSHTSSRELAALASRVHPGLLVLYHLLVFGSSCAALLDDVRAHYDGDVLMPDDLTVIAVGGKR